MSFFGCFDVLWTAEDDNRKTGLVCCADYLMWSKGITQPASQSVSQSASQPITKFITASLSVFLRAAPAAAALRYLFRCRFFSFGWLAG